jgi:hypothetical protein
VWIAGARTELAAGNVDRARLLLSRAFAEVSHYLLTLKLLPHACFHNVAVQQQLIEASAVTTSATLATSGLLHHKALTFLADL